MLLTLRGVALGAAMFATFVVLYLFFRMREAAQAAHLMPGQQIGFDIRLVSIWTIQNPMFWVVFVVMAAVGSEIVRYWRH